MFQRHRFGARSEQLNADQLALALEELDAAVARVRAGLDATGDKPRVPRTQNTNRGRLPAHLERVKQAVDVDRKACACCGGALHVIGEDVAERFEIRGSAPDQRRATRQERSAPLVANLRRFL